MNADTWWFSVRQPPDAESRGKEVERITADKNESSEPRPSPKSLRGIQPTSDTSAK